MERSGSLECLSDTLRISAPKKAITGETYGVGQDVDQLVSSNLQLTYNLPSWKIGAEFEASTAWYGSLDTSNGKVVDTHSVTNFRILGVVMYSF